MHKPGIIATGELVRTLGEPLTGHLVDAFGHRHTADVFLASRVHRRDR